MSQKTFKNDQYIYRKKNRELDSINKLVFNKIELANSLSSFKSQVGQYLSWNPFLTSSGQFWCLSYVPLRLCDFALYKSFPILLQSLIGLFINRELTKRKEILSIFYTILFKNSKHNSRHTEIIQ